MTSQYNYLNLPESAAKTGMALNYVYDATGNKLSKIATQNGTTTTRHYVGGIEYNGSTIDMIQTEEGIAQNNGGSYTYHYNLTDHLGNVRYSFDIYGGSVRKLQEDDYYPYGLRIAKQAGTLPNDYLYNGKELQQELKQYDYGARFYDPVIGRWNVIDPLAEIMRSWSPYNYGANNPIRFIDPDGRSIDDYFSKFGKYLGSDNVNNKEIRIVSSSGSKDFTSTDNLPFNFYNSDGSVNREVGQQSSQNITELSSSDQNAAAGGVYNHYYEESGNNLSELKSGRIDNTTNQNLAETKIGGVTPNSGHLNAGEKAIEIDYSSLGRTLRNGYDIINLISHERGGHMTDYLTKSRF